MGIGVHDVTILFREMIERFWYNNFYVSKHYNVDMYRIEMNKEVFYGIS